MKTISSLIFAGWYPIARVVVIGVSGYLFLLFALRTAGPRTLAAPLAVMGLVLVRRLYLEDVLNEPQAPVTPR